MRGDLGLRIEKKDFNEEKEKRRRGGLGEEERKKEKERRRLDKTAATKDQEKGQPLGGCPGL